MSQPPDTLAELEQQLTRDFERLSLPVKNWCPETPADQSGCTTDVLIVGAGMCGLAAAFALRCNGITSIRQLDYRDSGKEGPWLNYARMQTLRSPKHLTGPALGFANLTFRAWYEAQHGSAGWEALDRIDRTVWMDYLCWYRKVTGARVENKSRLISIEPQANHILAHCSDNAGNRYHISARQLVLATGREGQSSPRIPTALKPLYPDTRIHHSSEAIEFSVMAGKPIAVIGLSASAFDNAAAALEAGASQVTLLGRADALPRVNKMKQTVYPGFTHGYPSLSDEWKLRIMRYIAQTRIAPPRASVLRIAHNPRARLLLGAEVISLKDLGNSIQLFTKGDAVTAERIILATGFALDIQSPPECKTIADHILLWGDRMPNEPCDEWMQAPYLGDGFELLNRKPDGPQGLQRIRCFTHTAQLSLGNLANDIPAVSEGAERLARAISRDLFKQDIDHHWRQLQDFEEPELFGDEWTK